MSIIIIIIFIINKLYLLLLNLFHIWKKSKRGMDCSEFKINTKSTAIPERQTIPIAKYFYLITFPSIY